MRVVEFKTLHDPKNRQVVKTTETRDAIRSFTNDDSARRRLSLGPWARLAQRNPKRAGISIVLNDIYVGHHFDGGTRGKTGEFYWNAVVSDGDDVVLTDSNKHRLGVGGVIDKIAYEWLGMDRVPLYAAKSEPSAGSLTVGFRLMESDDGDEAKRVFAGLNEAAQSILTAAGVAPSVGTVTDALVKLTMSLIDLDEDDVALTRLAGLKGSIDGYRRGRFITMNGSQGSAAVLSVLPEANVGADDFRFYEEHELLGKVKRPLSIPKESQLSFFVRRTRIPDMPPGRLTLSKQDGSEKPRSFLFRHFRTKAFRIGPGDYNVEVETILPAELDLMVTSFGPGLAMNTYL